MIAALRKRQRRSRKNSGQFFEHAAPRCIEVSTSSSTLNAAARKMVLPMKTNITLKIEADLLREARVLAAEAGTSIGAMLAIQLEKVVRDRKGYHLAQKRALARLRKGFDLRWTPPISR